VDRTERQRQADALHEEGATLADAGDREAALAKYMAALALDMQRLNTLYNIGLYHKYRGAWAESLRYNKRAVELEPESEAGNWNLAIAATALREWTLARACWQRVGIKIPDGSGPIEADFGSTVVRLAPDGEAETVWARRICPVRARIINIPFPESGYAWGDVVLHDGAPTGSRLDANGRERSVFNVLEMFEPSMFSTFVVDVEADGENDIDAMRELARASEGWIEDWSQTVHLLCKACSEGRAHESHDHDGGPAPWKRERRIGIAARSEAEVEQLLAQWAGPGRTVMEWGEGLER
jgi:tetratricopeptide (TPR) repeat protein